MKRIIISWLTDKTILRSKGQGQGQSHWGRKHEKLVLKMFLAHIFVACSSTFVIQILVLFCPFSVSHSI